MLFTVTDEKILRHFPLPKIRDKQMIAIRKVLEAFAEGYRHVFLEAPTGLGKSAIGVCVGSYMNEEFSTIETPHKTAIGTITKFLQDQVTHDFPRLRDIRSSGDPRYMCEINTNKGTEDCIVNRKKTDDKCMKSCPYKIALMEFRKGPLSISNVHFIANAPFRYNLGVIDECHEVGNVIASQAELKMTDVDFSKLSLIFREDTDTVKEMWDKVVYFIAGKKDGEVFDFMDTDFLLDIDLENYKERVDGLAGTSEFGSINRQFSFFANNVNKALLISNAKMVKVIEKFQDDRTGKIDELEIIRPIYAREFAPSMIFSKADRFLHMSATICGFEGYAKELGLNYDQCKGIEVDHVIDAERRLVHFRPVSWMSAKNEQLDVERTVNFIDSVIDKFENQNTIIHSTSYKRAQMIRDRSKHDIVIPKNAKEAVSYLKTREKGCFVASPSLIAGVDGKDDMCRVNIIAKVPFPSFGDPRVKYLAKHNPEIINQDLVRRMVQAAGRGTRHEEDYSTSFVIDGMFEKIYNEYRHFFPKWFVEALRF
ncbi:putative ATP-dependent helicase [Agrobacterium phage Atu_ph04]|uniref:Putative ATP-dependent helicase n=1 Tax=Agrobacterium phage Atu_ph04 TaxID=2024263 RepID=A0A223W004_9CAUD|nr:putative ATP-dependent helicase [Agrobacterium phage Atu_ph04]ASV44621.1 putative ATP-dependent helicase [Agrobacterium phage Atu_ph04]